MSKILRCTLLTNACLALAIASFSQSNEVPRGWHLMDKADSGYYGISMDKAYRFVTEKKLKSTPVIVAVIDSGIDTLHEDLKAVLWRNPGEIPGNGIDDDKNGYIDDVYGWNFLGGTDGANVEKDSYEAARVYHQLLPKWGNKEVNVSSLSPADAREYDVFVRARKDVMNSNVDPSSLTSLQQNYQEMRRVDSMFNIGDSIIRKDLGKQEYSCKDLQSYNPTNDVARWVRLVMTSICRDNKTEEITNAELLDELDGETSQLEGEISKIEMREKAPRNYRNDVVKDNYNDINDRFYGNNNVMVSKKAAMHGTHVAGIIAAARDNGVGMNGVADNVKIMMVRAVPDGDEHDKDIALAIRYAVDNGAKVINMSFGKGFSPEKKWVDDAVKYAASKNVLLVHAAGNSALNIDTSWNFPTPVAEDKKRAPNWITVGASGDAKAGGLVAGFSNYGKNEVDVFAPGVQIYSTVPGGNTYQSLQGTSMASPVVAGLAAFILEYYPSLSPEQVKKVIEQSSRQPDGKVEQPGTGKTVKLSELSRTGGVINAYEAIKLAAAMAEGKPEKPTRSRVKEKEKS